MHSIRIKEIPKYTDYPKMSGKFMHTVHVYRHVTHLQDKAYSHRICIHKNMSKSNLSQNQIISNQVQ